jgi:hypothetical protein
MLSERDLTEIQRAQRQAQDVLRVFESAGGFEGIQRQTQESLRAFQTAGGFQGIRQQVEKALHAFQSAGGLHGIRETVQQQSADVVRLFQAAGGFEGVRETIQQQTEEAVRVFQSGAAFQTLRIQAGEALAGFESMADLAAIVRELETASPPLPLPTDAFDALAVLIALGAILAWLEDHPHDD